MQRIISTVAASVLAAAVLAGCGGGHGAATLPQTAQVQNSAHERAVKSLGGGNCTPDSYGYCVGRVTSSGVMRSCVDDGGNLVSYWYGHSYYDIYYQGSFYGTFESSNLGSSGCPPPQVWSPSDPRVTTGDPNLP